MCGVSQDILAVYRTMKGKTGTIGISGKAKLNNFPWRVSAIEQESELLIDPKSLTMPIKWIERENKEVRIPQGDSKPKRE